MKNDELRLGLITSAGLEVTLDEFVRIFRHRFVNCLWVLPAPLVILVLQGGQGPLPDWFVAGLFLVGSIFFFLFIGIYAWIARRLIARPRVLHLPFALLNLPAMASAVAVMEGVRLLAGGGARGAVDVALQVLSFALVAELLMALARRILLPQVLEDLRGAPGGRELVPLPPARARPSAPPPVADLPAKVRIGGRDIAMADLSHILGEGSAVIVHFGTLSMRLSARFATVIGTLPEGAGLQINRNIWISAPMAGRATVSRSGRETVLLLPDGTRLPVAPTRRVEVAAWLRAIRPGETAG